MNIRELNSGLNHITPASSSAAEYSKSDVSATFSETTLASDKAHVSLAAQLTSEISQRGDANAEKVANIQKALSDGSYSISSEAVADSLMNYMQQG